MKNYKILLFALFFVAINIVSLPLTVNAALDVSCSPNSSEISSGGSVTWSANVSGGDGNYTYDWNDEDGNMSSDPDFSQSYVTASDNVTISKWAEITVTDGLGDTGYTYCDVTIIGELTFRGCEANEVRGETGVPIRWTTEVVGGIKPYNIGWTGDEELSGDSDSILKSYVSGGIKSALINTITSADGQIISGPFACGSVEIFATPEILSATCSANSSSVRRNATVNWTAEISGGTEPYSITWSGDDDLSGDSETVSKSYSTTGDKEAFINVSSSDGQMVVGISCVVGVKAGSGGGGVVIQNDDNDETTDDGSEPMVLGAATEATHDDIDDTSNPETNEHQNPTIVTTTSFPIYNDSYLIEPDSETDEDAADNENNKGVSETENDSEQIDESKNTANSMPAAAAMAFVGDNVIWFGLGALMFIALILFGLFLKAKNQ